MISCQKPNQGLLCCWTKLMDFHPHQKVPAPSGLLRCPKKKYCFWLEVGKTLRNQQNSCSLRERHNVQGWKLHARRVHVKPIIYQSQLNHNPDWYFTKNKLMLRSHQHQTYQTFTTAVTICASLWLRHKSSAFGFLQAVICSLSVSYQVNNNNISPAVDGCYTKLRPTFFVQNKASCQNNIVNSLSTT